MEGIIGNYTNVITKHYVDFEGRARRSEFWYFVLVNIVVAVILNIVDSIIGTDRILGGLYSLAILLPSLGLAVRRLHDIGKSGWWLLIALVPLIGAIVLIYWYAQPGTAGANTYGADPKLGGATATA